MTGEYFVIHVEEVKEGVAKGSIMNPYIDEFITFRDLGDMVLKIDKALRWIQEEIKQRGADNLMCYHSFRDYRFQTKTKYFFLMHILNRENFSWQGILSGSNGPRATFKSVLELISMVDQYINERQVEKVLIGRNILKN